MARATVQLTDFSLAAPSRSDYCQSKGSSRCRSRVTMISSRLMTKFPGLRSANALDNVVRYGQSLSSKVVSTGGRREKCSRIVPKAMLEGFTEASLGVIKFAENESRRMCHDSIGTEHILLGLLGEKKYFAAKVLRSVGIELDDAREEVEKIQGKGNRSVTHVSYTAQVERVLEFADEEARKLDQVYIGTKHLLLGLVREDECVAAKVLEELDVDLSEIRSEALRMAGHQDAEEVLADYGTNISKLAEEGKLDHPVVGRQEQILRVIQILCRKEKNNPCLIGDCGVRKTDIIEGLAQRIAKGDVPKKLQGKKIMTLETGKLTSGYIYRYVCSEKMEGLMEKIKESDDEIILFIDKMHTLIDGHGEVFKSALASGKLQWIGATTEHEYQYNIETDPDFESKFQPVKVPEASVDETIQILKGLRKQYEIHHNVRYTDESLVAAAQLAHQYIKGRLLPDKAIDLIDEAGSQVQLRENDLSGKVGEFEIELRQIAKEKDEDVRNQDFEKGARLRDTETDLKAQMSNLAAIDKEVSKTETTQVKDEAPVVTEVDIQQIVSKMTEIPVEKVSSDESDRLLKMEETLRTRVIGQDEAVKAISRAIRRARVGLKDPKRPIASFIFSGPTGVGKTELAKALAACYFGSEDAMIRLDMSEYMESHTVSKLIGSPPGYVGYKEGGQLTRAVCRRPYTVVLFDEIEKAHPDVFNMMLQILEDGRLTDGVGTTADFKNTLLIMTSNVGSKIIEKGGRGFGFDLDYDEKDSSYDRIKSLVKDELKQYFRPEFLNRLDEMIVFRQLTKLEVKEIADIMLKKVFERLKKKKIQLEVTEKFRDKVVDEGYDPSYGARPLRRAIMRLLEDSLAEKMLAGEINEGDSVIIDVDSDGNVNCLKGSAGGAVSGPLPEEITTV
ncbi:OLC1v1013779C1 [Oldenlandia corymbosa var. corymbosa]|uniref:OLC1v1013779C1 n=1 Tax=Oldenlandia corymbosa var. corymbosa TaxID=529605 RepID=A0AAV1DZZ3_OLDCO|nr:OLC1v1013779C1 [Oldenlandia corymbosa var. corymbosa]